MSGNDFASAAFGRAQEIPDDVTVTRPVAETRGLQPEDLGVLVHLLLLEPGVMASGRDCVAGMRALGWKMSDERFAKIAKRLTGAGHLYRKSVFNPDTGRPQWRYWAYRNPANNPAHATEGSDTFPQVSAENREKRGSRASEHREKRVSPGQSREPLFPGLQPNTAKSGVPSGGVFAGQNRNPQKAGFPSFPPHTPPGGLVNPPTVPPRSTKPESVVAAVAGGDNMRSASNNNPVGVQEPTEAELHAAGEFLADLPGRWACGLQDVEKYAKLLSEAAKRQGWPLDAEFERWLTADERSIRGAYPRVIPARLKNLPRYSAWRRAGSPTGTAANRGPVEDPCPNHPHRAAADCVPCRIDPDDPQQKPAERPVDPVPADVIAAAKAFARSGKSSGRHREKNPRSDARARRQAADARSAEAEAEAEENRRKAAVLLQQDAAAALGLSTVPGQAHNHPAPR